MQPEIDIERRALALFERLSERTDTGDNQFRDRLLRRETAAVRQRVDALERAATAARAALPTLLPESATPGPPPPARIGPFRLVEAIGEGGMGQVWLAQRDDGLYEQRVAIKLIRRHLAGIADGRFEAERRILARLEHPNIARIIDGGVTADGVAYIIIEYVDGTAIDLAAAGLPLAARVQLFVKAADAVQFAHGRLVIHADLKPPNILVEAGGRVRLLDFGIARLVGDDSDTGSTAPMTREFASPERRAGAGPSIADDVHALGVTLAMMTGDTADADLAAIIARARAADPARRYGSVAEFIADLDRWRDRLPVAAQPDSLGYRTRKFVGRHRVGVAATAAAFVALAATATIATINYNRAERERIAAAARFDDARGAARYLLFDVGDRLGRQPNSLPLRVEIAGVAQHYLDRLALADGAPPDVRLEAAEGLLRLADDQGAADRPNLGQAAAARANFAKAIAAVAPLDDDRARRLLARILIRAAWLESEQFNDFNAAEALLRRAAPLVTGDARLTADHAAALSSLRQWQGDYATAVTLARASEAAVRGDDEAALIGRERATGLLGDALYYGGDRPAALAAYRRQIAALETLVRRDPGDPAATRRLNIARWAAAVTLLDSGRAAEALPIIVAASAGTRAAAALNPDDAGARRSFMITENVHAQALAALGHTDAAVATLTANIARRRALWVAAPHETARLRDYGVVLSMLADVEADAGRIAAACGHYGDVRALLDGIAARGQLSRLDGDNILKSVTARQAQHCRKRS